MLPPVRTISGSSGSYQNSASVSASAHLTGEASYPGHTADADRDVNPNHSGKLNVLLLNGRDTVPESLSMVADALGRAVNITRREGETPSAYVTRLAVALTVLPAALKADAEQELMKILRGVRLQLVIDAFLNPTGPEAARIVALLEMAGTTERDLAALTVLTSYRQNDGADIAPVDANPSPPPPVSGSAASSAANAASAVPVDAPVAPAAGAAVVPGDLPEGAILSAAAPAGEASDATAPGTLASGSPSDITAEPALASFPEDGEDGIGLIRYHESDNIFSRTSVPEPEGEGGLVADMPAETTPVRRAMADLDPARFEAKAAVRAPNRGMPSPTDARGLQTVLQAAFAAGDSEDPLVQAKAAMDLLAGDAAEPAETGASGRLPLSRRDFASRPFADYQRPVPRPLPRPEDLTPIFGLKGWPEDVFVEPGIVAPVDLVEAALTAKLVPPTGALGPDVSEPAYLLRGRGIAANDAGEHKAALEAAEQQLIRTADQAAGLSADRRAEPASLPHRHERSGTDQLLASALQLGADPRITTGFASVPYPVADERDEGRADRRGYRRSPEDEAGNEPHQGRDDDDAGSPDHHASVDQEVASEDPIAAAPVVDTADPAYDFYQRMAGWS